MKSTENFISQYLRYTENTEPPEAYNKWVAIWILAAAMGRRHIMKMGDLEVYPNLYVIIIGPAGRARKSTAVKAGTDLLVRAEVKLAPEAATKEALIDEMQEHVRVVRTQDRNEGTVDTFTSECNVLSSELGRFFKRNDNDFLNFILHMYDCPTVSRTRTRSKGEVILNNVFFNMLGATTPTMLPTIIPEEDAGSGLRSRLLLVAANNNKAFLPEPSYDTTLTVSLLERLIALHTADSVLYIPDESYRKVYREWYVSTHGSLLNSEVSMLSSIAEYYGRKPIHILKLSAIHAAGRASFSEIRKGAVSVTKDDFVWAVSSIEALEPSMFNLYQSGETRTGNKGYELRKAIMMALVDTPFMSMTELKISCRREVGGVSDFLAAINMLVETSSIMLLPEKYRPPKAGVYYMLHPKNKEGLRPNIIKPRQDTSSSEESTNTQP